MNKKKLKKNIRKVLIDHVNLNLDIQTLKEREYFIENLMENIILMENCGVINLWNQIKNGSKKVQY